MVPRAPMLATKNRVGAVIVSLLAVAIFVTACAPPGPSALLEGKELLEADKVTEAIEELKTATSLMPTNAAAWNYLGVAYHRAGLSTNAVEAYSRALRFNRELIEVRFNVGCVWLELEKFDAAKVEFTAYTLRRPNEVEGWLKLGGAQLQGRDLIGAEKSFREALRVDAKDVVALNGLGLIFVQRNRARDAVDSFTAALQQRADYRPALLNLATVLQQQNDRAGALKRYREYLALQPPDADWEAVNAIARALEPVSVAPVRVAPTNTVAVLPSVTNMSRPLVATNGRAVAQTKTVVPTNPPKPAVTNAPVVRVSSNPAPPAAEVVKLAPEPVIKTTPEDKSAALRVTPAISTGTVAVAANTSSAKVVTNTPSERKGFLSKLNPFKREPKAAVPESLVVTSTPNVSVSADSTLGRSVSILPQSGDRKAAELELAQGQQAQRAGKLAEAIQSYRRATELDGSYFEAHYSLGLATFALRDFKAATTAWEKAISLRSDSRDARYNYALTLKAADRPQAAAAELERLLALHPDEARGHLTLGNLYAEQLGDKTRARRHYQQVLQLDPRNPQAQAIRYWLVANPG